MHTAAAFRVLLRGFRLVLTVEGLRPKTVNNYLGDVERFTKHFHNCSPRSISPGDSRACMATLEAGHSLKTVREGELALRRFFRSLAREGSEWTRSPPITKQR